MSWENDLLDLDDIEDSSSDLNSLIFYLNDNTDYEWDANEIYNNCAISESIDDYIEVFIHYDDNGNVYYTINEDEEEIKDLETLINKLPELGY